MRSKVHYQLPRRVTIFGLEGGGDLGESVSQSMCVDVGGIKFLLGSSPAEGELKENRDLAQQHERLLHSDIRSF